MLTKNFVSAYKAAIYNEKVPVTNKKGGQAVVYSGAIAGNILRLPNTLDANLNDYAEINIQVGVMVIGDDDTPATAYDYDLKHTLTSGFDVISQTSTIYTNRLDSSFGTITRVIKNTSSDLITVKEIGYLVSGSIDHNNSPIILLAREVLTTPVTIQPGEKYSFTLDLCVD